MATRAPQLLAEHGEFFVNAGETEEDKSALGRSLGKAEPGVGGKALEAGEHGASVG
jgi:hypothetical protein